MTPADLKFNVHCDFDDIDTHLDTKKVIEDMLAEKERVIKDAYLAIGVELNEETAKHCKIIFSADGAERYLYKSREVVIFKPIGNGF